MSEGELRRQLDECGDQLTESILQFGDVGSHCQGFVRRGGRIALKEAVARARPLAPTGGGHHASAEFVSVTDLDELIKELS